MICAGAGDGLDAGDGFGVVDWRVGAGEDQIAGAVDERLVARDGQILVVNGGIVQQELLRLY